jgi:hypothetical protein
MTAALEGGEGSASRPSHFLPPGKTQYPLYRRLGGPQDQSGQVWKFSPPPGFDPRIVQPVASRYTDYATRPTLSYGVYNNSRGASWYNFKTAIQHMGMQQYQRSFPYTHTFQDNMIFLKTEHIPEIDFC